MTTQPMTRRESLRRLGGMAAGLGLFHIVPAWGQGNPAPSERLTCAAIGVGGMGSGNLGNLLGRGDVRVVAVCDVEAGHAQRAKESVDGRYGDQDCAVYGDYRDVFARGDVDIITIGTPDHWHAPIALAAARARCDVYGEKPFSHSLAEGREVVNALAANGCIWQTGSWQRSVGNFYDVVRRVRAGLLGRVVRVEVGLPTGSQSSPAGDPGTCPPSLNYDAWVGPSPYRPYDQRCVHGNWRWVLDFGGGQLLDWVGHHGDIAHWGLGFDETGPVKVVGSAEYPTTGVWDAPYNYRFTATYADGTEMIVGNSGGDLWSGTRFYGADGSWIWVDRGNQSSEPASLLKEPVPDKDYGLIHSTDHMGDFVNAAKTRGQTVTPAETAHRSASIGHLGHVAMMLGRELRWDPATETAPGDDSAQAMLTPSHRGGWF